LFFVFVVLLVLDSFESLALEFSVCAFFEAVHLFFFSFRAYLFFFSFWNAFKEIIWKEAGSSPLLKLLKLLSLALSNFFEALHSSCFLLFQRLS
jgi:hypothetical protein